MKKLIKIFVLCLVVVLMATPSFAKTAHTMMEVREIQTQYFETDNDKEVMRAAIHTLQDNGFIIQNIEDEMGYITARKDFRAKRTDKGRVALYSAEYAYYGALSVFSFGAATPYLIIPTMHMKNELSLHPVVIDANVTIDKVGKRTKVRFAFVEKIMENADGYMFIKSAPRKVVRYYAEDIYQEFFSQLSKNIFIENTKAL